MPNEAIRKTGVVAFQVVYENGARSDVMFSLDAAIWEAIEHAEPGEDVYIEDEQEYVVWNIIGGKAT